MSAKLKAHSAIILANILFGINYSLSKELLAPIPWLTPEGLCIARIGSATLMFSLIFWCFKREKIERRDIKWLLLASLFGIGGNQFLFLHGIEQTSPIDASIIATTSPIMVLLLGVLFKGDKLTPITKLLGIVIAGVGALTVILYGGMSGVGEGSLGGNLLIFSSAFSYACYLLIIKDLMAKYSPYTIMMAIFGFSGLFLIPTLTPSLVSDTQWSGMGQWEWFILGFVIVGATWTAYLCVASSLKSIQATTASVYSYSQPVVAAMFAIFRGQDSFDLIKLLAAVMVVCGVYLVTRSYRKSSQSAARLAKVSK